MLGAAVDALILIKSALIPPLRRERQITSSSLQRTRWHPPRRAYITGCSEGSSGQGAERPASRYRGNPLNLIRVMPAKGQDMATVASPRISLFLARLLGPLFLAIAIGVLVNGAIFRAIAEEGLRSHALIYLTGLFAVTAGVAILLNHNVWAADWRVLITIFGWLAAIGGAQRIIWPQWTEAAIHWFLANPRSLVVAGIIWLVIGAVLCFYGYFRESGAT